MKLSKTLLPLLLSSALWMPVAYAAGNQPSATPEPQSTTGTPNNPGAVQPAPVVPPVDSAKSSDTNTGATTDSNTANSNSAGTNAHTNANATTTGADTSSTASVDTSGWTGKTVKGSDGKKLGTVGAAAGDKVNVDTKWGSVELASNLVAADETGDLTASTTSVKDVQAMAKSQKGDMKGAQAVSKKHFAKKAAKATVQPASMTTGTEQTPTEQAPAGETPSGGTTEQAPAAQTPQQAPANTQPPASSPPSQPPH